jgi:chromosome segregation ATPase
MPGKKREKNQRSVLSAAKKRETVLKENFSDSKQQISDIREDADKDSLILALNHKIFQLTKMLEENNPDSFFLQSKMLDADSIIERLRNEVELRKSKNLALENENIRLKQQRGNLEMLSSEKKAAESEVAFKEKTISDMNAKLSAFSSERFESEQKLFSAKEKLLDADRIIRRLRAENEELLRKQEEKAPKKEALPLAGIERMKSDIEQKSKEILELKAILLKNEDEKDALRKKAEHIQSQMAFLQSTARALQENVSDRDRVDDALYSDIEDMKKEVAARDAAIAQLRLHFQQRNKIDERLTADIISLKKNISEKNNAISELISNNRKLVEMGKAADSIAKNRGYGISDAKGEIEKLKREIEQLNSLIQKQQAEHKKTTDDLTSAFELSKQMMFEEYTQKEVALNMRIKELEEMLSDAKRSMQARNDEISSMVKNLNEQSGSLLSSMEKPILEAPPEEFMMGMAEEIKEPIRPKKSSSTIKNPNNTELQQNIPSFSSRSRIPEIISSIEIASQKGPVEKIKQSLLMSGYTSSEIESALSQMKKTK